ncbi:hypothetical protein N0P26_003288 [Acinetobacter baumannii]|uniref:Uncharacterized protein n=1 Tax=Acinetobacter baumannii TaxID=470 RepID=A0A9P2P8B4_ACIBA|nr:hypothetical protein [Acinetobacter baumannii]EKT9124102.1 hypothetical protein [Acinetobacter baumannii]EKT9273332.1 hypothetical protein [Acinetobacter baumannii]EKT9294554.1 hypothetical protein [Acinetobacter baumannii]EKT9315336.1 hypothetical protein [Acinetobacter baumannii]EKU0110625.1 hypothetical protein [Acinetobacter baumannii]
MVNNEKGSVLPRRPRESVNTLSGSEDKQELQKKIVESAPLQTSPAQQTNPVNEPPADVAATPVVVPEKSDKEKYPWRADTDMSAADLMVVKKKKSYDIPYELVLRLDFIRGKKKPKALGEKVKEIQLLTEYLDKATRAELKKLGYEVD